MTIQKVRLAPPLFGAPVLRYQNNGMAGWCKENSVSQWQKGSGWTANLYGGTQTGDDWAAAFIPVNELHTPDFNSAMWTYYMTNAEVYGVNMVIWLHDPNNGFKRAEVTQAPSHADLSKVAGWNSHTLNTATAQFFWYGEDWSGGSAAALSGSDLTSGAGNQYTWAQYQTDNLFRGWTISRISLEYGWYSTGTFEDAWLADLKLNGERILLQPQPGERAGGETKYFHKATAGNSSTRATLVTPAATKRIRIHSIYMVTASSTTSTFELYFDTGTNITSDATKAIVLVTLDADTVPGHSIQFGSDGPLGVIGDVVSMRTGTDITTNGSYVITYHEE